MADEISKDRYKSSTTNVEEQIGNYDPKKVVYAFSETRGWGYNKAENRMYAAMYNSVPMVIGADGNIGINCTNPDVKLDVNDNSIRIRTPKTPVASNAAGTKGQIAWDSNYIYVCVNNNTWKRAQLSSW